MNEVPKCKRSHRGGKKHRKSGNPNNASAPLFAKKQDHVSKIHADQIAEGRRMMRAEQKEEI